MLDRDKGSFSSTFAIVSLIVIIVLLVALIRWLLKDGRVLIAFS